MPTIKTRLSQLLSKLHSVDSGISPQSNTEDVDIPIISAPMATATSPDLVAAVTAAGGFGLLGAGNAPSSKVRSDIRAVKKKLDLGEDDPVPIGIGFVACVLDKFNEQVLEEVLEEKTRAVWLAFGTDLGKYVARVRAFDSKRDHKSLVFVIVNSVEEAIKAAEEWKVDVIVVQGIEAGGHGYSKTPPLFDLVPQILNQVNKIPNGPLVVAAGGVSTGKQIAALLTLGVDGVVLGTRFLFTPECVYTDQQKEELLKAGLYSTTRSVAFDEVSRLPFWPEGYDGRAISNAIIEDSKSGLDEELRKKRFQEAQATGANTHLVVWAGIGAGLVDRILPVTEVVNELRDEAVAALKAASKLI